MKIKFVNVPKIKKIEIKLYFKNYNYINMPHADPEKRKIEYTEYHSNMLKLFTIIEKLGDEKALREAYNLVGENIRVKYEALEGTKTKKERPNHWKHIEYKCYLSVYDKYAGSIKKPKPLCYGYIEYTDEDFDFDKETKKFVYKYDKKIIINKKVKILK